MIKLKRKQTNLQSDLGIPIFHYEQLIDLLDRKSARNERTQNHQSPGFNCHFRKTPPNNSIIHIFSQLPMEQSSRQMHIFGTKQF